MTKNRFEKAHFLADNNFCKVLDRDMSNRPQTVLVPGSNGKQYEVIIRRKRTITTECMLNVGAAGNLQCKGSISSICYHSLAALIVCANEQDSDVSFCDSEDKANKLKNISGEVYKVMNHQATKALWIVVDSPVHEEEREVKKSVEELKAELGF